MHEPAYACLYGFAAVCMRADSPGHYQAPRQPMQIEVDVERFRVLQQGESSQSCHGVPDTAGPGVAKCARSPMRAAALLHLVCAGMVKHDESDRRLAPIR
jgi:hypothetical protein